jgi:DNA-binding CsgD family transcriptional regulator
MRDQQPAQRETQLSVRIEEAGAQNGGARNGLILLRTRARALPQDEAHREKWASAQGMSGREQELAVLDRVLEHGAGLGGALVIHGEAGIGKSFLLAAARKRGEERGMRVLCTAGVECETNLPFAGLHQLLRPLLRGLDQLPTPQREALEIAFGVSCGPAPELFLVALATLSLLVDVAVQSPILVVAEDAHWLDRASADVLAFVGRRLESDPIVMLLAVREGFDTPFRAAGLAELELKGLDDMAAQELLDGQAPRLARSTRECVLTAARGNPLALVELPRAVGDEGLHGAPGRPDLLPLTRRLERAFASRVASLSPRTRMLLLVAALNDGSAISEVLEATGLLLGEDLTGNELAPAVSAALLEISDGRLRFRHPLARSAIRQTADIGERRRASGALAKVVSAEPDRSAWHRAAATLGPNEEAASDLDAAGTRAQRRGSLTSAVAAWERAAELSEHPEQRVSRLLRAAELALDLGRADLVARLVSEADGMELSRVDAGRIMLIREMVNPGDRRDRAAVVYLVQSAEKLREAGEHYVALDLLWAAATRSFFADLGWETRQQILTACERLSIDEHNPRLLLTLARAAPIERAAVVIERATRGAADENAEPVALSALGNALGAVGAQVLSEEMLSRAANCMREEGRLRTLTQVLGLRAWADFLLGHWSGALSDAEEARRLADETGQPIWAAAASAARAILFGVRGEQDAADALAADAERVAVPLGVPAALVFVQLARGMTALSAGRHAEAYEQLWRLFDPADPCYHSADFGLAIGYLAEAAVQSGHNEQARALLAEAEAQTTQTPSPWLHVSVRHARALLASEETAEEHFQTAMQEDLTRWPFDRARLQLAYGVWLRRQRRPADSRTPLRAARDCFDALGAIPWSERARQELRAAGEKSRQRVPDALEELSPQEMQIARMAAEGLTNREIGQKLYLSHRTVGSHLYRTFPKLGITSRTELRAALEPAKVEVN